LNYFLELIIDPSKAEPNERELIEKILDLSNKKELLDLSNKELDEIFYGKYSVGDVVDKIVSSVSVGNFKIADKLFNQINILFENKFLPFEYKRIKREFLHKENK